MVNGDKNEKNCMIITKKFHERLTTTWAYTTINRKATMLVSGIAALFYYDSIKLTKHLV